MEAEQKIAIERAELRRRAVEEARKGADDGK
jgi:hypothetical protein